MWIKTISGDLVNAACLSRIYWYVRGERFYVMGINVLCPPSGKTSQTDQFGETTTEYNWDDTFEDEFILWSFETKEEAQEYVNKLAAKLGAEEI